MINKNNKLIISAAGSGKTTHLICEALKLGKNEQVLITTYTIENEEEIRRKILEKKKSIPSNITIIGWFTFLLKHGVKPYQGSMNEILFSNDIKGMLLTEGSSSIKRDSNGKPILYNGRLQSYGEDNFSKFYFTKGWKIYSDKISKFVVSCNEITNGEVISRISRIYSHVYIDEIQDLAGFDLEIIRLLFKSPANVLLVGDPRQVTYLTNHYNKHKSYQNGKIKEFLLDKCKSLITEHSIDETTLKKSHRNNLEICNYSSKLYPDFEKSEPCLCKECRGKEIEHEGVFIVPPKDVDSYLETYNDIVQLRWDKRTTNINKNYPVYNFGQSKGKGFNRVLIYPTPEIKKWIKDNTHDFTRIKNGKKEQIKDVREKFYVALTRARYSVALVYDIRDNETIEGTTNWKLN